MGTLFGLYIDCFSIIQGLSDQSSHLHLAAWLRVTMLSLRLNFRQGRSAPDITEAFPPDTGYHS